MAEFVEVMKQKKRMCEKYKGGGICTSIDYNICPLKGHELCNKPITCINIDKIQEGEGIIMRWAADNPEPVYPTWGEWLLQTCQVGITTNGKNDWDGLLLSHIPADIAQKLGIEPKEV